MYNDKIDKFEWLGTQVDFENTQAVFSILAKSLSE